MTMPNQSRIRSTIVIVFAVALLFAGYLYFRTEARVGRMIGSEAAAAVFGSEDWELVSLFPFPERDTTKITRGMEEFDLKSKPLMHGFFELGRAALKPAEVEALRSALSDAVLNPPAEGPAECFWPRHGLVISYDGKRHEILICFQCSSGSVRSPNHNSFVVSKAQESEFNRIIDAYGLPHERRRVFD